MVLVTTSRVGRIPASVSGRPKFFPFFATVVIVQGLHSVEHIIQLVQVYVFGVPSERAFGVLGYVFNFSGTAEWLHLVYNVAFLSSLFALVLGIHELLLAGVIPRWAYRFFLVGGVGLETWHMTEHAVIISRVISNHGCPCPGIGDRALNVSDIQLHFVYNAITYSSIVVSFVFVHRRRRIDRLRASVRSTN